MSVGTSLNNVHRDCSSPFANEIKLEANNTPESFDNWKWFRSPWTNDGKTVYGLIHNEFHGWENPGLYSSSGKQDPCLFPNVTVSQSTDGGKTFFDQFHASKRGSGIPGQTYPSILDPTSAGLNFEYSSAHPYLYFTRFNPKEKEGTWHNRDLIRVPIEVSCSYL